MGATFSVIKALIAPAIIALILFLVLSYVLVPLWQRYQQRYTNYLPLDAISDRTSTLRYRIQGGLARYLNPSTWRRGQGDAVVIGVDNTSDGGYDSEEGEELGNVGGGRQSQLLGQNRQPDVTRRLSRDLEQGFIDDSSSDSSLD